MCVPPLGHGDISPDEQQYESSRSKHITSGNEEEEPPNDNNDDPNNQSGQEAPRE